jgi:hypothetical protein
VSAVSVLAVIAITDDFVSHESFDFQLTVGEIKDLEFLLCH